MATGTDYYLEVIKLLRLSMACQQPSNYFVNWQELFMRHGVNRATESRIGIKARPKATEFFGTTSIEKYK